MTEKTKTNGISVYSIPGLNDSRKSISFSSKKFTSINIKSIVADYFKLGSYQLDVKTRITEIREPRQLTHFFSKEFTKESLSAIGRNVGNNTHATVINSIKTINNLCETDKNFNLKVNELRNYIIRKS